MRNSRRNNRRLEKQRELVFKNRIPWATMMSGQCLVSIDKGAPVESAQPRNGFEIAVVLGWKDDQLECYWHDDFLAIREGSPTEIELRRRFWVPVSGTTALSVQQRQNLRKNGPHFLPSDPRGKAVRRVLQIIDELDRADEAKETVSVG